MDLASLIGLVGGIGLMLFGIISNNGSIPSYLDVPSFIITFGGSLMSVLASFKLKDFINGLKGVLLTIKEPKVGNVNDVITNIIDMSNVARKEGLLALEEAAGDIDDEFLKKGINPEKILSDNDSYHALESVGGLIITGPTGTNVNDFACVLVETE